MSAFTNAQRQKRWRERHITGDLFPPLGVDFSETVMPWPAYCEDSDLLDGPCYSCPHNAKGGPGAFSVECVHPRALGGVQ